MMTQRARICAIPVVGTMLLIAALSAGRANAEIEITPSHIQGTPEYAVQGTLHVIDVPSSEADGGVSGPGGPDWPDDADDGFTMPDVANLMYNDNNRPGWEPDGTSATAAPISWMWNKPGESVNYSFDLPDGAIIHNVWATWHTQGNAGTGHTHTYDEGTLTTFTKTVEAASAADLVLRWTDDAAGTHDETFQRIFPGPIAVAGGDGFVVTFTQVPSGTYPYIDAVVVDFTLPAVTPPDIAGLSPANGTTNVPIRAELVATFDKAVALTGSGTVTLRDLTLGAGSDLTLTLPDTRVSVAGALLTIDLTNNLNVATDYAVQISSNAVEDLSAQPFAGITDDTTWTFTTTPDGLSPTILSTVPVGGASDVAPIADMVATLDEPVVLTGSGTMTVRNLTLGSESDRVLTLPDDQVSVSGAELTINLTSPLDTSTDYAVQISADAIKDLNENPFAGIDDDTTWRFTTAGPKYVAGLVITPDHIQGTPTYAVVDALKAIDVPTTQGSSLTGPLGPDWPEDADDGFELLAGAKIGPESSRPGWEPDGTDDTTKFIGFHYGGAGTQVRWTFDLPDGSVIHNVYAHWFHQGNSGSDHTYTYDEGTPATFVYTPNNPAGDLVLQWVAHDSDTRNVNFQRIFEGPITVSGDDGFAVTFTHDGGFPYAETMLIDVTEASANLPTVILLR